MKILGVIFIGIFCVPQKDLVKAKTIGYCDYQCSNGGGCEVNYIGPNRRGNTKGSCFPLSFGGDCSGIPRECQQNCHTVISCKEPQSSKVFHHPRAPIQTSKNFGQICGKSCTGKKVGKAGEVCCKHKELDYYTNIVCCQDDQDLCSCKKEDAPDKEDEPLGKKINITTI